MKGWDLIKPGHHRRVLINTRPLLCRSFSTLGDDAVWTWDLELQVDEVVNDHELHVARPPQYGIIAS